MTKKKYLIKKTILTLILSILITFIQAQKNKNYFRPPVKGKMTISGNFGELRPNHFHAGLDIVDKEGTPIYACADGYISRILVSTTGYGKALYINHPNGYKTVYGHLSSFNNKLNLFVKNLQKEKGEFNIKYYPKPEILKVKKGEIIGYMGNSGYSFGSHLHFEIRETEKDIPVNPLKFNLGFYDKRFPEVSNIYIYPLNEEVEINGKNEIFSSRCKSKKQTCLLNKTTLISGPVYIGVETKDRGNGNRFSLNAYSITVKLDNKIIYNHKLDKISFYESRYINSLIDFKAYKSRRKKIQKCYIEPGNLLKIYSDKTINKGVINLKDNKKHKVKIEISDLSGNKKLVVLFIKHVKSKGNFRSNSHQDSLFYNQSNYIKKEKFRAIIPKFGIYNNMPLDYSVIPQKTGLESEIHKLQDIFTPLHKYSDISISIKGIRNELKNKLLIVKTDSKMLYPLGGIIFNDFITAKTKSFGSFAVAADTIPPSIIKYNFPDGLNFSEREEIKFKISDNLSGIDNYFASIDNKNIIFEYDKKTKILSYKFEKQFITEKIHTLKLIVVDKKNNRTSFTADFFK